MIQTVTVVFACLLPQVTSYFTTSVWIVSSALYLVPATCNLLELIWINRKGIPKGYSVPASLLLAVLQIAAVLILAAGSLSFTKTNPEGYYLLAVLLTLMAGSLLFLRLVATSFREAQPG